jgi:peroxiredoxin
MKTATVLTLILLTCIFTAPAAVVPQSAEQFKPLLIGQPVPQVILLSPDGTSVDLRKAAAKKPTVIIFYRGGWCPYCNRHLAELQQIEADLLKMGFQILAISPDRPEKLQETLKKHDLTYQLLSDSSMEAARAFGIAFQLDDATVEKYKESYKIDLEADSGHTHHQLPVPAVFLTDTSGEIIFIYTNPYYKVRLSSKAILETARTL